MRLYRVMSGSTPLSKEERVDQTGTSPLKAIPGCRYLPEHKASALRGFASVARHAGHRLAAEMFSLPCSDELGTGLEPVTAALFALCSTQ
jgi:hypothetical protein